MTPELVDFITNWEVESYRSKVSLAGTVKRRLENKIAIVTGSAQGFGRGIAEELASEGAYIIVAHMNEDGAKECAAAICDKYGKRRGDSRENKRHRRGERQRDGLPRRP